MCHGDFPDDFFTAAKHKALYQKCLYELSRLRDDAHFYKPSPDDMFTRMGRQVSGLISTGMELENLELSYLSLKSPGIRQAVYKAAMKGPGKIICAGAAGLMVPGHGMSESLPHELKGIVRDNPALDLVLAPPGIGAGKIALLIRKSLEYAFRGSCSGDRQRSPGASLEDSGIVLVCSHDYGAINRSPGASGDFSSVSARLSDLSKAAYMAGGRSASTELMRAAASSIGGFHAVEAGFMDFALPDVVEAATRLVDAGSTHIIASGTPSLLHRHPYSLSGPSRAVERLRRALPDTSIIYVKPDPEPIAGSVADVLMARVLEAERSGTSLKWMLREL
jgi:sirohydrochlorin cobaltochelatase